MAPNDEGGVAATASSVVERVVGPKRGTFAWSASGRAEPGSLGGVTAAGAAFDSAADVAAAGG
jgi:hypothetical protein